MSLHMWLLLLDLWMLRTCLLSNTGNCLVCYVAHSFVNTPINWKGKEPTTIFVSHPIIFFWIFKLLLYVFSSVLHPENAVIKNWISHFCIKLLVSQILWRALEKLPFQVLIMINKSHFHRIWREIIWDECMMIWGWKAPQASSRCRILKRPRPRTTKKKKQKLLNRRLLWIVSLSEKHSVQLKIT